MPFDIQPEPEGRLVTAGTGNSAVDYHVIELGAPAHDGQAPAVFLHGGGPGCTAWTDFGPVAPMFASDRRCLLVDLLQYGRSEKCTISGPMWDFHARTIDALLHALEIERADFICNSWGGSIALNVAAKYPARTRSLVITGSMPVFRGPMAPLPEGGRRGRKARDAYFGGEGPTEDKMRTLMAELECTTRDEIPDATVKARYLQSIDPDEMRLAASADSPRGEWQDLTAELGDIRCPRPVRMGHVRRLPHPRLSADVGVDGRARPALRDGQGIAPPAEERPPALPLGGHRFPRPA